LVNLLAKLKEHWTLLVVSHDASELVEIADRCWTINHGRMDAVTPADMQQRLAQTTS
ncbi:MAG: ABC transporter ATP-binding protein, partial [Alkalinema sp. RL_2_19]|nr:ABC transporter ATP-binding protein [Alkalinema sp. RL_2_19]